jgi:hypothetical protein
MYSLYKIYGQITDIIDIQYYKKKHAAFSWEFYGRLPLKMVSKQEHLHDFLSTFCLPGNIMGCKTPVKTKQLKQLWNIYYYIHVILSLLSLQWHPLLSKTELTGIIEKYHMALDQKETCSL